jgi:hypothetical protein
MQPVAKRADTSPLPPTDVHWTHKTHAVPVSTGGVRWLRIGARSQHGSITRLTASWSDFRTNDDRPTATRAASPIPRARRPCGV